MRKTAFLLDGQDYWDTGEYSTVRGSVTRDQVLAMLRTPEFAARNPRVWVRAPQDWVPVV